MHRFIINHKTLGTVKILRNKRQLLLTAEEVTAIVTVAPNNKTAMHIFPAKTLDLYKLSKDTGVPREKLAFYYGTPRYRERPATMLSPREEYDLEQQICNSVYFVSKAELHLGNTLREMVKTIVKEVVLKWKNQIHLSFK